MPIATTNPHTGEVVKSFQPHDANDVESRIARSEAGTHALRRTSFSQRAMWATSAADILDADAEALARTVTVEMGKPVTQAEAEIRKSARGLRYYAANAEAFLAPEQLADAGIVGASVAGAVYQPVGIVLAVMPWNYPIWQVVRFAAPALMAGNACLLKHASNVPSSAMYLDELFTRAGFPDGAFQTLLVEAAAVTAIVEDPRVRAVTLTGSEPAGRAVAATAGRAIKKTVMELGGSDPFIVMPSADLDAAVEAAVHARTLNNGQSCIAGKRFIVHTDVYDRFAESFAGRMSELKIGDPLDRDVEIGPLATRTGRDELAELVEDAVSKGAVVLAGGTVPPGDGWFYPPTVLGELTADMRLVMEEAFGPVACLYRAEDLDHALVIANQTTFGLSSAVWTNDPDEEAQVIERIAAGAVFINGITVSHPELPFGGTKNSGYGRELAAAGIREFCNLKTVWKA